MNSINIPLHKFLRVLCGAFVSLLCVSGYSMEIFKSDTPSQRPNILLVVADDLGTFDIGAFGGEINTPNIDVLANQGLIFTDFHTAPTCSPTRSMLLTGVDAHAAGLGNMVEHISPNQRGAEGYEGHFSDRVVSVSSLLQDDGYRTYMAGKWHLGMQPETLPVAKGFDESFVLLQGGASYFNDMMGLTAVAPDALYRRNENAVTELPEDFYATEYYADFIIDQLSQSQNKQDPFFAYLAFSAPHWPLQVKDEHVDLYKDRYDAGYEYLLEERLRRAQERGILADDMTIAAWPSHVQPWSDLSPDERETQSKIMEVYAAVVERMDFHLGRVMSYLGDTGQLENTLIIFMSDNGADGSDRSKLPGNDKWLPEAWDLSFENMGKKGSYVYPGAAWARASVGPYSMYKEFLSQGGIKSPLIVSLPSESNPGTIVKEFVSVKDIVPTILEFTGTPQPGNEYEGQSIAPIEGSSLMALIADGEPREAQEKLMGWELFGQKAIRLGDWKLLWLSSKPGWLVQPRNADQWGLFNLAVDPAETNNLISQEPEKFAELLALWDQYAIDQNIVLPIWE